MCAARAVRMRFPFETPGYAVREDCLYGGYSRGSVVVGYDFVDS